MQKGILGKKVGMTQLYTEAGTLIPVTLIEAGPCPVLQLKEVSKDRYCALKLGFDDKKEKGTSKPDKGNFKKGKSSPKTFVKELRVDSVEEYKVGQVLGADIFKEGEFVDITGLSKGKGFQGGMKRWNWTAGKAGHGSMHHRRPGSIGASSFPSRVFRGQHMPGQMGNETVTVQNLEIIKVSKEDNLIVVKGTVPGHNSAYLEVRSAKKMPAPAQDGKSDKAQDKKSKKG